LGPRVEGRKINFEVEKYLIIHGDSAAPALFSLSPPHAGISLYYHNNNNIIIINKKSI
jgi:hypothetical protein